MPKIANISENVKREPVELATAEVIPFPKRPSNGNPVFPLHALELWQRGYAVMPLEPRGKSPLVSGFGAWGSRPGQRHVEKWCETMPSDANIGIIPGLGKRRMWIFDCDTHDAAAEVQDRFGPADPGTDTSRGCHLYYESLPFRPPGNLRKWGIDADIKSGSNQYAVAPYSIHESGFPYARRGDWAAPLGKLNAAAFQSFITNCKPEKALDIETQAEATRRAPRLNQDMREDSRGLWMNDEWCREADSIHSRDTVLMMGARMNMWLGSNHPLGCLPDAEVVERGTRFWNDLEAGRLKRWGAGRRGVVKTQRSELQRLKARGKGSTDAIALLTELRSAHPSGAVFAIAATAMARAGFMPRKRIEKARAMLMQEGLIEKVRAARMTRKGPVAAEFKLTS